MLNNIVIIFKDDNERKKIKSQTQQRNLRIGILKKTLSHEFLTISK